MTIYRKIISLIGLNLSQTNIILSNSVSKAAVNKSFKLLRKRHFSCLNQIEQAYARLYAYSQRASP